MFKRQFFKRIVFVLIVGLSLIGAQSNLQAKNFEFFVNSGLNFGYDTSASSDFYWNWNSGYDFVVGYGPVDPSSYSKKLNFSAGLNYFFTPHFGISLSVNHSSRNINLFSDFIPEIIWTSENISTQGNFNAFSSVTITPVMVELLYKIFLSKNTNLNVHLGGGLFFTQFNTINHYYFWGSDLINSQSVEWYDIGGMDQQNHTYFGGDVGIDIEHKISQRLGIFAGCQYYYIPEKTISEGVGEYYISFTESGQSESIHFHPGDFVYCVPQEARFNLSYLRAFVGIKVYF